MSHYIYKRVSRAKFEGNSSSSYGDYDVTKFPSEEGNESSDWAIYPWKTGLTFKKMGFYVQNRSSRPKIDPLPLVNLSNFQAEEKFFIFKILGRLDEKRAAAAP